MRPNSLLGCPPGGGKSQRGQLGKRLRLRFLQDRGALLLDGPLDDVEVGGDSLARVAREDEIQDFALPRREVGNPFAASSCQAVRFAVVFDSSRARSTAASRSSWSTGFLMKSDALAFTGRSKGRQTLRSNGPIRTPGHPCL